MLYFQMVQWQLLIASRILHRDNFREMPFRKAVQSQIPKTESIRSINYADSHATGTEIRINSEYSK